MPDRTALTPAPAPAVPGLPRPQVAWLPVTLIAAAVAALLAATAGRYGYHRDELYFRVLGQHPAWGYIDQPPGTPLLSRLSIAVFGDSLWGLRVPAIACAVLTAMLTALVAREVGGRRAAQSIAAAAAAGTFALVFGHILLTATLDLVVWLLVILFVLRALLRSEPRWWLAVGLTAGLGTYNKLLIVLLLLALGGALLLTGPRSVLTSRWLWAGMALGAAVGSPNLIYQVAHGFPELAMAAAIRRNDGANPPLLLLAQVISVGLPLAPITVAGLIRLLRDRTLRPARAVGAAYLIALVVLVPLAGQPYYTAGLVLALHAVGSVAAADWPARRVGRRLLLGLALAVNAAVAVSFALPVLPVTVQNKVGITALNPTIGDQIGWPAYVSEIAAAYRGLPPGTAADTVIITGNYGEYGAVARYGKADGLPVDRLYSGHNELRDLGTPPDSAGTALVVGLDNQWLVSRFSSCTVTGHLDSGSVVDNEEQGRLIEVCTHPRQPWHILWPQFYHYD